MRHIPLAEWAKLRYDFMNAGERVTRLPFCHLKPHKFDSFGSLRAWPKWKTLQIILPLTQAPMRGGEDPAFLKWLSQQAPVDQDDLLTMMKVEGDIWSALRWRPLVSFMKYRWKHLYHLAGKFCLHTLRTLNAGFHLSNPRGFTEKVHRFNNTARPILDTQYSETMHEDCGTLVVRVFDLKNFFPEVPHAEFDALLRLAICLLLLRNPRWRFF